jgi:uncharacterized membrane-anchored protein
MENTIESPDRKTILINHELRKTVLDELHARPFLPVSTPRRIYHYAFTTTHNQAIRDRINLEEFAREKHILPPSINAKFHYFTLNDWRLRWEQHTEFTTYTWSTGLSAEIPFKHDDPIRTGEIYFQPPGKLITATQIAVTDQTQTIDKLAKFFNSQSLCVIDVNKGNAEIMGDFYAGNDAYTKFILRIRDATPLEAGRLAQRILEIETYRTMALLALPLARDVSPQLREMEKELTDITHSLSAAQSSLTSQDLLKRLSDLLVSSEAVATRTAFRFGASRAYHALVNNRLDLLEETKTNQYPTLSNFLSTRLNPAIETCNAIEKRQHRLSTDVERATNLMRTGITLEMERQNSKLLNDMNRRTRLQMRLNTMVQGISVAALAYYLTGLFSYIAQGLKDTKLLPQSMSAETASALGLPIAVIISWAFMARVRYLSRCAAEEENIE